MMASLIVFCREIIGYSGDTMLAVNGKFSGITRNDLLSVDDRFGIGTAPQVLKQVGEAVSVWPYFSAKAGVGPVESRRILEHHLVL